MSQPETSSHERIRGEGKKCWHKTYGQKSVLWGGDCMAGMEDLLSTHVLNFLVHYSGLLIHELSPGENEKDYTERHFEHIRFIDEMNRLHWSTWNRVTKYLTACELARLVKNLTLIEKHFKWIGGSVSAVIWTFNALRRKDIELAEEVSEWALSRTDNPYVPFGGRNYGARDLNEYRTILAYKQQRSIVAQEEQEAAQKKAKKRREERKAAAIGRVARQKELVAVRRHHIEQFMTNSPDERLRLIAEDDHHLPDYYPPESAAVDDTVLRNMEAKTKELLFGKLADRRKGIWHKFYVRLKEIN